MNYRNEWIRTLNADFSAAGVPGSLIDVKFRNHAGTDVFTRSMLEVLKTDRAVEYITDSETGEILFPLEW